MATNTRAKRRINRNKLMKFYAYTILALLVLIGFALGRVSKRAETKTIYQTVEVPIYEESVLPEAPDLEYFNIPISHSLQRYIFEICADEQLPVSLILAMIEHESQFNADIISSTDDYGLMQINTINHQWLKEEYRCADMLDPYQNVFCGIQIVSSYLEKYNGDYHKALMAYNMGDYGARKAWENGVKTSTYSEKIVGLMEKYEEVSNGKS